MNRTVSLILSIVFHPVLVNVLALWLLFQLFPGLAYAVHPKMKAFYMLFIFISAGLFPMAWVLVGSLINRTSLYLDDKEERHVPYLITSAVYLADFYLSRKTNAPGLLSAYLLACSSITVAVLLSNFFYKISIHAASMGALTAVIASAIPYAVADLRLLLALSIAVSGLVLTARLFMNAHTLMQTLIGFGCGLVIMVLIL
jgi:hypothetical protein